MTTSVTRPCFTSQRQTCKTKTKAAFLVSDRSCPETDGLRPHHWFWLQKKILKKLPTSLYIFIYTYYSRDSVIRVQTLWSVTCGVRRAPSWWICCALPGSIRLQSSMKKAHRETQILHAGCSKAEPQIFAPPQTPFPVARDGQNLISWRWTLPSPRLQTQFGEDRIDARNFELSW